MRGSRAEGVLDKGKAGLALPVGLVDLLPVQMVEVTIVEDVAAAFLSSLYSRITRHCICR